MIVDDVDAELDREALIRLIAAPRRRTTAFSLQHERRDRCTPSRGLEPTACGSKTVACVRQEAEIE